MNDGDVLRRASEIEAMIVQDARRRRDDVRELLRRAVALSGFLKTLIPCVRENIAEPVDFTRLVQLCTQLAEWTKDECEARRIEDASRS